MKDDIKLCIDINGIVIQLTDGVNLLDVTINSMLSFNQQVQSICRKASNKGRAPNLENEKYVMVYNSFVLSNLNYCQRIWVSNGKSSNNEIYRLHKRARRVLSDDCGSTFKRAIQILLLEVYKCLTSKNPSFLRDIIEHRPKNYNLRIKDFVQLPSTKTARYGLNSLKCRGSKIWNTLPEMIKSTKNDQKFKKKLKIGRELYATV